MQCNGCWFISAKCSTHQPLEILPVNIYLNAPYSPTNQPYHQRCSDDCIHRRPRWRVPLQRGEVSLYLFAESGGRGGQERGEREENVSKSFCVSNKFPGYFSPVIEIDNEHRGYHSFPMIEAMQPKQKVKANPTRRECNRR